MCVCGQSVYSSVETLLMQAIAPQGRTACVLSCGFYLYYSIVFSISEDAELYNSAVTQLGFSSLRQEVKNRLDYWIQSRDRVQSSCGKLGLGKGKVLKRLFFGFVVVPI